MDNKEKIKRLHRIQGLLDKAHQNKTEARLNMEAADADIKLFTPWVQELREGVCGYCSGTGKLRHFIAQDEVHFEKCHECNGTGLERKG